MCAGHVQNQNTKVSVAEKALGLCVLAMCRTRTQRCLLQQKLQVYVCWPCVELEHKGVCCSRSFRFKCAGHVQNQNTKVSVAAEALGLSVLAMCRTRTQRCLLQQKLQVYVCWPCVELEHKGLLQHSLGLCVLAMCRTQRCLLQQRLRRRRVKMWMQTPYKARCTCGAGGGLWMTQAHQGKKVGWSAGGMAAMGLMVVGVFGCKGGGWSVWRCWVCWVRIRQFFFFSFFFSF